MHVDVTADDVPAQPVEPFEAEHDLALERQGVAPLADGPHLRGELLQSVHLRGPRSVGEVQGAGQRRGADRPLRADNLRAVVRRFEVVQEERLEPPGQAERISLQDHGADLFRPRAVEDGQHRSSSARLRPS